MRVLYVSSEIVPYASTGGLAEVSGALPKALLKRDIECRRIMPLYRRVAESDYDLVDTGMRFDIPVGFEKFTAEIWKTSDSELPVTYFVRKDEFFDRSELYSLPERDYDDNFKRFVFFQKAVVALIDSQPWKPDIVHCNDWQSGLVPLFLEHDINGMGRTCTEKTVFTIHNLAYQGIFPGSQYSSTNLPFFCFNVDQTEFYGNVNCIKAGITTSNIVTTVSETYAHEIQSEEFGYGLHGVLAQLDDHLIGIVNGVDYSQWDPQLDPHLVRNYTIDDLAGKKECKRDLEAVMGLKIDPEKPLIGMVTRLVDQKGLDLIEKAMPVLMEQDAAFVLLGFGVEKYHRACEEWAVKWPEKFAMSLQYNETLAHKIIAGSDISLVPSRYEPCGLNQMYSLKYGSIPVVHATGGLEDTIEQVTLDGSSGTGFKFNTYTAEGMLGAIKRACDLYKNNDQWQPLLKRSMQQDFSWERAAEKYHVLYQKLMG